jgi:hypothetical protein
VEPRRVGLGILNTRTSRWERKRADFEEQQKRTAIRRKGCDGRTRRLIAIKRLARIALASEERQPIEVLADIQRHELNGIALVTERGVESPAANHCNMPVGLRRNLSRARCVLLNELGGRNMRKSMIVAALLGVVSTPGFADDNGIQQVVAFGTGVSVGEDNDIRNRDTTVSVTERDNATVIKKGDADANREDAVLHQDDHN